MKVTTWILPEKAGKRFRMGHPWIFANELAESPKGIVPGSPIEVRTPRGQLLARGYGNPHSLICFRTLTRKEAELEPWTYRRLNEKVHRAWKWREQLGLSRVSHRLVFGEADDLPGIVLDRFVNDDMSKQILVLQILTAGMEKILETPGVWASEWVEPITGIPASATHLIVRRDVGARKLEGLELLDPKAYHLATPQVEVSLADLNMPFVSRMKSASRNSEVLFDVDLVGGQKTGFFFDQAGNLEIVAGLLKEIQSGTIRILDLFCYVGQWGTQLSQALKQQGASPEVHFVDGSRDALKLAKTNGQRWASQVYCHELDIMEGLRAIPDCEVVICDPPAFIKNKKDHGAGMRGYVKANAFALEKVKPGGLFVSCSCSHHLKDEDMIEVLKLAEAKANRRVRWLARGIQAPDHPVRIQFPEGQYLKSWIGRVDE